MSNHDSAPDYNPFNAEPPPNPPPPLLELLSHTAENEKDKEKSKKKLKKKQKDSKQETEDPKVKEHHPHFPKLMEVELDKAPGRENTKGPDEITDENTHSVQEDTFDNQQQSTPLSSSRTEYSPPTLVTEQKPPTLEMPKLDYDQDRDQSTTERAVSDQEHIKESVDKPQLEVPYQEQAKFNQELPPPPPPKKPYIPGQGFGGFNSGPPSPAISAAETTQLPPPNAPRIERTKESRSDSGIFPALVVHFLSRRRDKRLRREHVADIKKVRQEITDSEKRQATKQELPRPNAKPVPITEKEPKQKNVNLGVEYHHYNQESKADSYLPIVELEKELEAERRRLAEEQEQAKLRHKQALQRMLLRQKRQLSKQEKMEIENEKKKQIINDLEVDKEATPEKVFDRRHEVLDRRTAQAPQHIIQSLAGQKFSESSPTPISKVLSDRNYLGVSSSKERIDNSKKQKIQDVLSDDTYKNSLKTGFFVGVAIIIIGAVAYFST